MKRWKDTQLPVLARRLVDTCRDGRAVNLTEKADLPPRAMLHDLLDRLLDLLRPGYDSRAASLDALEYVFGYALDRIYGDLTEVIRKAFLHDCRSRECAVCTAADTADEFVADFLERLPDVRELLKSDAQAAFDRDPAAANLDTILLCYPCMDAVATYRLAHELALKEVPIIPRIWTERAHSRTGIDIHPRASIGQGFFIDHGAGVVIGETCQIGDNVTLYQGVTLGAFAPVKGQALRGVKRHPTLENDVVVYSGATILGGDTVIGEGSVIGGNVWITKSVPPHTRIILGETEQLIQPLKK